MKILLTIAITGETAEAYAETDPVLIFEDFVARHNGDEVELVEFVVIDEEVRG